MGEIKYIYTYEQKTSKRAHVLVAVVEELIQVDATEGVLAEGALLFLFLFRHDSTVAIVAQA